MWIFSFLEKECVDEEGLDARSEDDEVVSEVEEQEYVLLDLDSMKTPETAPAKLLEALSLKADTSKLGQASRALSSSAALIFLHHFILLKRT